MPDQAVIDSIKKWDKVFGVPDTVSLTIANEESSLMNLAPSKDTNGADSIGPFQLNMLGQGAGYQESQLQNIDTNVRIGISNLAPAYMASVQNGLNGYTQVAYVASHSGHPGNSGTLPASYDAQLRNSYAAITGQTPSGSSTGTGNGTVGAGSPTGWDIGGYIRVGFWGALGIGLILLGVWIMFNPFADITGALRGLGNALNDKATNKVFGGATRKINNATKRVRFGKPNPPRVPYQRGKRFKLEDIAGNINDSF